MSKATASSIGLRQGTSNQRTLVTSPYFATGVATPTVSVPSRTSSTTTSSEAREKEKEPRDSNSHISLEYERAGAGGQPPDTETSSTTTTGASSSSSYSLEEQPPNSKRRKVEKQGAITDFFRSASNPNKPLSATPKQPSKEPPHWREHLANIQEMRKNRDAPVDHMGCGAAAEIGADGPTYRYQVLLSAMLSSQTKDQQTDAALRRLIAHGCTIDNILNTSQKDLEQLIYPVRWREKKAQYILKTTRLLKERHNSDVPNNFKDLVALPGIGPKMAHLILSIAWNNTVGISVDTHVHRISARLGWTHLKPNATPEDTRKSLEEWLPLSWWRDINKLFVGFGQTICLPVNPRCSVCLNNQICPSSSVLASSRGTSRANTPSNNPPRIGDSEVTTGGRA